MRPTLPWDVSTGKAGLRLQHKRWTTAPLTASSTTPWARPAYNSITTKEGRYIQFKGGSVYGYKENGQPYVHIPDGLGNMFEFTSDKAQAVFERLSKKLKSDGILPPKFQISQNKEKPYYERDDIDNAALSGLLQRQGGQLVQPRVRGSGQGNTDGTDQTPKEQPSQHSPRSKGFCNTQSIGQATND